MSQLPRGDALDIPLNQPPGSTGPAKLMFADQGVQAFDVGLHALYPRSAPPRPR